MRGITMLLLGLAVAGCGSQPAEQPKQESTKQAVADQPKAPTDLNKGRCPFGKVEGWYAQIEPGKFSVDGRVDFMMAGYEPALKKRADAASGTIALDLSLGQVPGGAVDATAHYEEPLSTAYRKVEIHCGGEVVASFEPLDQRL